MIRALSSGLPSHTNDAFTDEEDERSMGHHFMTTDDEHYQRPPIDVRANGPATRATMNRFNELVIDGSSEEIDDDDETDYQENRSFFVTRRPAERSNNGINNFNNNRQVQEQNVNQLPPHLRSNGFLMSNQNLAPSRGNNVTTSNNQIDPPPFTITKLKAPRATVTTDDDSELEDYRRLRSRINAPPSSLSELPSRRPNGGPASHSPPRGIRGNLASDSPSQLRRNHIISNSPPRSPPRSPTRIPPSSPTRSPTRSPPRRGGNGMNYPMQRQESPPLRGRGMAVRGRMNGSHQSPIMQRSNGRPYFNDSPPSLSDSDDERLDNERIAAGIPQGKQALPIPPQRTESLRGKKSSINNASKGRDFGNGNKNLRDRLKKLPQKRPSFPYRIQHLRHDNESVQSTDSSLPSGLEEARNMRSPRHLTERDIVQNYRDNVVRASMRLKGLKQPNGNARNNVNQNYINTNGNIRTNRNGRGTSSTADVPSVYYHSEQGRVKPGLPNPSYFI